jgi:hypothetical protein
MASFCLTHYNPIEDIANASQFSLVISTVDLKLWTIGSAVSGSPQAVIHPMRLPLGASASGCTYFSYSSPATNKYLRIIF